MINYMKNDLIVYVDKNIKNKKLKKELIKNGQFFQINYDLYVNIHNIKRIDYVENIIVFNNNDVLEGIVKKINI